MLGWMRLATFAALSFAAGYLGRITFDERLQISLIVPASAVAVLWLVTGSRRTYVVDLLGIAVTVGTALRLEGATWPQLSLAVILTMTTAVTWLVLARWWRLDVRGLGGRRPFGTLPDLAMFGAISMATAAFTALLRGTGLLLLPPSDPAAIGLTFIRNLSWIFVIVSLGLLLHSHRGPEVRAWWVEWGSRPLRVLETVAALGITGGLATVVFAPTPTPYAFPLVLGTVWAAFRLPTVVAASIATLLGCFAVLRTLDGVGPFVMGVGPLESAAIAQGFLITNVLAALAISFSSDERRLATERARHAEREASARAALFEAALEHLHEGVSVITEDHRYSVRNPAALELTGRRGFLDPDPSDPDQPVMVGGDGRALTVPEMPHARALTSGEPVVRELVRVRTGRGEERMLEISSTPVDDVDSGHLVVNTIRDVTRQHEERDQLVSFAGVVAHDLKNPLTVIRGWGESLQEELAADGPPDVRALRSMVERVQTASAQMTAFIDDLLGITVARDRPLDLEPLDLSALAEEVAELRRTGGTQPRITVQPGMTVHGDRFLVRQLLDNLIGNAVKYVAPDVRPAVTVAATEAGDELEVTVTDNGVGIPVESRQRVFDSFVRAHGAAYTGTGLGLAICARVVARHGGRIWVAEEHAGPGTRIAFTLPTSPPA